MNEMQYRSPTGSYELALPADVVEDVDERCTSYWRNDADVVLQLSSYRRHEGPQVTAKDRLDARLSRENRPGVSAAALSVPECPDVAAAAFQDSEGILWHYCYCVWPHLTVFVTIAGSVEGIGEGARWALDALRSLRLRGS